MHKKGAANMSDKWKDKGKNNDLFTDLVNSVVPIFPDTHRIVNTETGETKDVVKGQNQTVGDAISKGQFKK